MKKKALQSLILLGLAGNSWVSAQSYGNGWSTIDGGGGMSSGGQFRLSGTIGQPEAGATTGGGFAISGGFWSVVQNPMGPRLSIERLANGAVRVFWPRPGTGFFLDEQGTTPNGVHIPWSPVVSAYQTNATQISITVPTPTGNRIFRLRKP